MQLDTLAHLPRTGWLMRGVRPAESIADHSFGVALCVLLLVDETRAQGELVDGEKALRMAILHDVPEAGLSDIPAPVKSEAFDHALRHVEQRLAERYLSASNAALLEELEQAESLEARMVRAADKIHMMTKALLYEQQGWAMLDDFWVSERNFRDFGVAAAAEAFRHLRTLRAS